MTEAEIAERMSKVRVPECAKTLGIEVVAFDAATSTITVTAKGRPEFCNPMGAIQGGFLCAMLDDAMALAAVFGNNFENVVPTLEMKVSFFAPARPGPIKGIGRIVKMGQTIAFLEGELLSPDGTLIAKASATARVAPAPKA